jgi:hypothetical protein
MAGRISIAQIKRAVAAEYGVAVAELDGLSVLRVHSRPRHAAMLLAFRLTDHSKARISSFFRKSPNLAGAVIARQEKRLDPKLHESLRKVTLALVRR